MNKAVVALAALLILITGGFLALSFMPERPLAEEADGFSFGALFPFGASAQEEADAGESATENIYTGYYVVSFDKNVSLDDARALVEGLGGAVIDALPFSHVLVVEMNGEAREALQARSEALSIEQEYVLDPSVNSLLAAADAATPVSMPPQKVNLYVLDSGAGRGVDYASTRSVNPSFSPNARDADRHGAVVAEVAEDRLEDMGIRGQVDLHSINTFTRVKGSSNRATSATLAEAIRMVIADNVEGSKVINISQAAYGGIADQNLLNAISEAVDAGIPVIVAAGNESGKYQTNLARHSDVTSVGALDERGRPLKFSNGLNFETRADVFADGVVRRGVEGTSFAAPLVAAEAAGLLLQAPGIYDADGDGTWSPAEIEARLKEGSRLGLFGSLQNGDVVLLSVIGPSETQSAEGAQDGRVSTAQNRVSLGTSVSVETQAAPSSGAAGTVTINTPSGSSGSLAQNTPTVPLGSAREDVVLAQNQPTRSSSGSGFFGPILPAPCDASGAYQFSDLVRLADNLVKFAVSASVLVATLMFLYAGVLYVTAAANPEQIKKAHGVFTKVFIGIVVVLVAWLVVDIIISALVRKDFGPWNEIPCVVQPTATGRYSLAKLNQLEVARYANDTRTGAEKATAESLTRADYASSNIDVNKPSCPVNTSYQNVSGGCTDTSGMRDSTRTYLKNTCSSLSERCVLTGGSELGHAGTGEGTHAGGDKFDLRPSSVLDTYIEKNMTKVNENTYRDKNGALWVRENRGVQNDHWDVKVPQ